MTKGFACNEGSVSPVTYEDQLRETSNDLDTACLLMMGKHGVSVYLRTCVCVPQTTQQNLIQPIKTIGTGEQAKQD